MLRLKYGGPDSKGSCNELVVDALKLDNETREALTCLDIITMGDLTVPGRDDGRTWIPQRKLRQAGLKRLLPLLKDLPAPFDPPTIRVGQCYVHDAAPGNPIYEILGWIEKLVCVRHWTPLYISKRFTPDSRYTLLADNKSRGAGSDDTWIQG